MLQNHLVCNTRAFCNAVIQSEEKMIKVASLFSRNLGQLDQGLRALAGTIITLLAWFEGNDRWVIIGVIILLTSVLRFCPTYFVLRFNTLRKVKPREVFPWDEFLDRNAPRAAAPVVVEPKPAEEISPVIAKPRSSFVLPPDLTLQLAEDLKNNALDEMLVLRFYENFFDCRISIVQQHVNNYRCDFQSYSQTYGFAELKQQLLDKLEQQIAVST
jgi:hypothetical protein